MKSIRLLALPVVLWILLGIHPVIARGEAAGRNLFPVPQQMSLVALESLEAEFFPANRIVTIRGSIKNNSRSTVRGYLTLYLLSTSGAVLKAFDLPLNDHRPVRDGESVSFDTAVNVSNVSNAYQVSVDFTRD